MNNKKAAQFGGLWIPESKERPTVLFFWYHGTPRSGDSYDLQVNEA